jgi:CBS domain-containing protein
MGTIKQILQKKGNDVWSIGPQVTAFEALEIMAEKNIGALLVVDEGKLVGIFSERDYARKVILKGKSSKGTPVYELMSTNVFYITPDRTIEDCMALMSAKHIRHLPVLENDKLVGIVTIRDVVKQIISDQEITIQDLENYISGRVYGA